MILICASMSLCSHIHTDAATVPAASETCENLPQNQICFLFQGARIYITFIGSSEATH